MDPGAEDILISVVAVLWLLYLGLMVALVRLYSMVRRLGGDLRDLRRDQQRQGTSILALHGAMKTISEDVINHGQVQSSVKRAIERLTDQQSQMQLREVDEGLYPQAIKLIQTGRSRDEVRRFCSLTESEVDLLFSLHSPGAVVSARKPRSPQG